MKLKLSVVSAAVLALFAGSIATAHASAITVDFESTIGYDLFNGAALSTAQSLSSSHSALLNDPVNSSLVRISPNSDMKLGNTSESFSVFLPTTSNNSLAPYGVFGVDVDGNHAWDGGVNDALVIAFITGSTPYTTGAWFQTGLDASTKVHVVGNRSGLADGTFSSSGTQGTLAELSTMSIGGGTWGDLNLLRAYVEIGSWPFVDGYSAYVDDIHVNTAPVPEPSTIALLGLGLAGLGFIRRRKAKA